MPAYQELWYRRQLNAVWDKQLLASDKLERPTPQSTRLLGFKKDIGAPSAACFPDLNLITFSQPDDWDAYIIKNELCGKAQHTVAHEFVHLAKDDIGSITDSTRYTHREFYADIKGLELVQDADPIAYDKILYYLSIMNFDTGSPVHANSDELLFCWAFYQYVKSNQYMMSLDDIITTFVSDRTHYNELIRVSGFLESFRKKQMASDAGISYYSMMRDNRMPTGSNIAGAIRMYNDLVSRTSHELQRSLHNDVAKVARLFLNR